MVEKKDSRQLRVGQIIEVRDDSNRMFYSKKFIPDTELTPKERKSFRMMMCDLRFIGAFAAIIALIFMGAMIFVGSDSIKNHQLYGDMFCKQTFGPNWNYIDNSGSYTSFDYCNFENTYVPVESYGFGYKWEFKILNIVSPAIPVMVGTGTSRVVR